MKYVRVRPITFDIIFRNLFKFWRTTVEKETFVQLCRYSLKTYLYWQRRRKEGLAIGSPLSTVLCHLLLSQFEIFFKDKKLKVFWRYVDEILCLINKNILDLILTFRKKTVKHVIRPILRWKERIRWDWFFVKIDISVIFSHFWHRKIAIAK